MARRATAVVSVPVLGTVLRSCVHYVRSSSPCLCPRIAWCASTRTERFTIRSPWVRARTKWSSRADAAWVANTGDGSVSKIDLERHVVVQTTPVGVAPQALAVFGSDLWVVNSGAATVSRVSLKTDLVVDTVPVGNLPAAIAADASGVWVVNSGDDTVVRIDPVTGRADTPIAVGFRPDGIAVDTNTVWVSNGGDGTVSPIDAKSRVVRQFDRGRGRTGRYRRVPRHRVGDELGQSDRKRNRRGEPAGGGHGPGRRRAEVDHSRG